MGRRAIRRNTGHTLFTGQLEPRSIQERFSESSTASVCATRALPDSVDVADGERVNVTDPRLIDSEPMRIWSRQIHEVNDHSVVHVDEVIVGRRGKALARDAHIAGHTRAATRISFHATLETGTGVAPGDLDGLISPIGKIGKTSVV